MELLSAALSLSCLILAAGSGAAAVEYTVTNNAVGTRGGLRFANEIGLNYSRQVLESATSFIWATFQQQDPATRKPVAVVGLVVESFRDYPGYLAFAVDNVVHLSADYIATARSPDLKRGITGVLYHEMVHVWQWNGNGLAPGGLVEGIADYVRLTAGYPAGNWRGPGQGSTWNEGYGVTAYFLDYCNSLHNGFVAQLNQKMRSGYSDSFFVDLLGKDVTQLWRDYKAKYSSA